jgi:DNA-binding beta-propeller fold protein YncE
MGMILRLHAIPLALLVLGLATLGQAQYVEDSIDVGGSCVGSLAYNPREDVVYGVSETGRSVFSIDCATNRAISRIPVQYPLSVTYDSLDNKAYVTIYNYETCDSVLVVDGATHQRLRTIPVRGATDLVWDRAYNRVYVSCEAQWDVKVIDCVTDSVIVAIRTGDGPLKPHINPRRRELYVQNYDEKTVAVIDLTRLQVTNILQLPGRPYSGAFDDVNDAYLVGQYGGVFVYSCGTGVGYTVPIPPRTSYGNGVRSIACVDGTAICAVDTDNRIVALDAASGQIVDSVDAGRQPDVLEHVPAARRVYCACASSDNVMVFSDDCLSMVADLRVSDRPAALVYSARSRRLYVGHLNSSYVYVIADSGATGPKRRALKNQATPISPIAVSHFWGGVELSTQQSQGPASELRVYSASGRRIRSLASVGSGAGFIRYFWDGRDEQGREAPAGVYLFAPEGNQSAAVRGVKLR